MSASAPKHVLITGGSRGIGLSIAHLFASQPTPHRCTLVSRNALRLSTAVSTLPASPTGAHATIPGDISAASFWTAAGIGAALGNPPQNAVDVLVNCAGVSQARGFVAMGHEELEEVVGTNLTGMMMGTRFLLRKRYIRGSSASSSRKRGDGEGAQEHGEAERNVTTSSPVIINISSLLGVKGGRGAVAYAASKAGVLGFTRALAQEIGPMGIRVNAIVPGYITSDMTSEMADSSDLLRQIPAGRFGKPEEVADAALFLARNQYANNCVVNLDGGLSAV